MAKRLRSLKEEPLVDERIPHPYREVIKELRAIRAELEEVKQRLPITIPTPVVIPPVPALPGRPPITVKLPPIGEIEIGNVSMSKLAELIAAKLVKLPNRVERIDVDTSNTTAVSLRKAGKIKPAVVLGFEVEDVGGGFSYTIVRDGFGKDEKTAITGDKWDQEFDDLLVKGSGSAGTAKIWYWWRA